MALFSGNLKKMLNQLSDTTVDWEKLVSLSAGRYDMSGKNATDGKNFVNALLKRAAESPIEKTVLSQIFRNISSHGADLNRSLNAVGDTPLHMASALADSTLLMSLLEAGIQPASTTHTGATALHAAVAAGFTDNVKLLLKAGADPGAEDANSNAPLHSCSASDTAYDIVKLLLEAGAKAYQRNSQGKTAVDLAEENKHPKCVELLRESLRNLRRNRDRNWNCPQCGYPIERPTRRKVEWFISLEMWDHLRFTCGQCGAVSTAPLLDGEL